MSIDMKFFGGNDSAAGGSTHDLIRGFPDFITMSAGDIIVVHTGGATTGGGLDIPVVSDNIDTDGSSWNMIGDSGTDASDFRTTKWWKLCAGGETEVKVDWVTLNTDRCFEGVICRGLGPLNEAYLISEGLAHAHFADMDFGNGDGSGGVAPVSSDGEIYIGCTAIGNSNYSFASLEGVGTHDNNGIGGDGQNGGSGLGVGVILHINDQAASHTTGDQLLYGTRPQGVDTWDSFIGIRAVADPTRPSLFGDWHFGGGDTAGHQITVSIGVPASAGDWLIIGSVSSAGGSDFATPPVVTDNIDTGGADWVLDIDTDQGGTYGSGGTHVTYWRKLCVGGETTVTVEYGSSTNKAMAGMRVSAGNADIYKVADGHSNWDGLHQIYTTGGDHPATDGEEYFTIALGGGSGADDPTGITYFTNQGADWQATETAAIMELATGECWARAGFDNGIINDPQHTTVDQVVYRMDTSEAMYVAVYAIQPLAAGTAPVNTVSPFIDNTAPAVGDVLTGDPGTWTGTAPITFTYQWLNYDGSDHNLFGETDITYTVTEDVVGTALWLDVRAHSPYVDEPGVEAISDHTDNVVEGSSPVDYTDAATVTLIGVPSGVEVYTPFHEGNIYDVGDACACGVVRAGRANVITVITQDHDISFVLQASPDGENWYNVLEDGGDTPVTIGVTAALPQSRPIKGGLFHFRLICTVADDGPATVNIAYNGGY